MIALLAAGMAAGPSVLDDPAFRFCHHPTEEDFDLAFCDLLATLPADRCPGLRERCAGSATVRSSGCNEPSETVAGTPGSVPSAPDEPTLPSFDAPSACAGATGLGSVLAWIVAMAVAIGILGVGLVLLRAIGLRPDAPPPPAARAIEEEDEGQAFAEAVDDVPDLPSDDLLAAARSALGSGRLGEASVLARGAVLRRLGERRVLRLHRARTDREYVGMADDALRPDLQDVLLAAERHRWGRVPLDEGTVQRALGAAARLVAGGVLLLVASVAHGGDRYGPAGDLGLRRVLERHGHQVSFRSAPLAAITAEDPVDLLVIDGSGLTPTAEDWAALRTWVEGGGVLWVAGLTPDTFPEVGARVGTSDVPVLAPSFEGWPLVAPRWPGGPGWGMSGGDPWTEPVPAAVSGAPIGDGYVLAVGDALLFWNGALVDPANEAFLGEVPYVLQALGELPRSPVRIQLATLAGSSGDPPPGASVANLRLLPFVIQVLVLWIALVVWRGWPFTRLEDPPERGRLRFVDHLDAVGRHYHALGATGHVLAATAAWALETRRRSGLLLAAARHGWEPARAVAFVDRMEALAAAETPVDTPSDLDDLEELWKLTRPR